MNAETTMPETPAQRPSPWSDQFTAPTREALLGAIEPAHRDAVDAVLEGLTARKGCRARVEWLGLPWRWTVVCAQSGPEHPALAYLVPKPDGPIVCVPVPVEGDAVPDTATLTKPVRQALDRSAIVAGYVWAEWAVEDVDIVALKPLLDARVGLSDG